MTEETKLNAKEQRLMRRWFRKTGENTIEVKEKRWGILKLLFLVFIMIGIYYDFIDPRYKDNTWNNIQITYQPNKWIENQFNEVASTENPNTTRWGQTKEEFIAWKRELINERGGIFIWHIYILTGTNILFVLFCIWPTKRRVRFDRKRGIIYTYVNNKFHLTEVKKLMRPFPEYFAFIGIGVFFWVHPYQQAKYFANARRGSQMIVSDYTMWLPMIFMWIPGVYQKNKGAVLKRFLVDFMNPNTPPERIASMMEAL
ncbi:hypothetical protein EDC44_10444 [Cricetibacter osteomyelitidis]|uniref:Uncharacterized protein n=1 Tax=Cricetibacter osteomyelitidis TaxID=1521931 RepID=A0A4R2T4R6_9PAST|nr:hypothetical protein [Cricetibacter osteomyelitidis]TCP96511.1 hypothetical protein EDC44_10444 [Cricetibacter osteomyelitidis]